MTRRLCQEKRFSLLLDRCAFQWELPSPPKTLRKWFFVKFATSNLRLAETWRRRVLIIVVSSGTIDKLQLYEQIYSFASRDAIDGMVQPVVRNINYGPRSFPSSDEHSLLSDLLQNANKLPKIIQRQRPMSTCILDACPQIPRAQKGEVFLRSGPAKPKPMS